MRNFLRIPTITAHTTLASCTPINIGTFANGILYVPSGATSQTLAVWSYDGTDPDGDESVQGNYYPLNFNAAAVAIAVAASQSYTLPYALFASDWIKLFAPTAIQTGLIIKKKS